MVGILSQERRILTTSSHPLPPPFHLKDTLSYTWSPKKVATKIGVWYIKYDSPTKFLNVGWLQIDK